MKHLKFLFLIVVILAVISLIVQNYEVFFAKKVVFKVNLIFKHYQTIGLNIALISLIAFLLGVIITWVYFVIERFQLKRQMKGLLNQIKEKDEELKSLRNLPITSDNVLSSTQDDQMTMA